MELIDHLKSLQEGILDSEKRMEGKVAAQMEEYVNGRLEDVKGTVVTSTPGTGTESEKVKVGKDEKRQDEDSESKDDEVSVGVEKKKRTSKNRRHEWLMNKRGFGTTWKGVWAV